MGAGETVQRLSQLTLRAVGLPEPLRAQPFWGRLERAPSLDERGVGGESAIEVIMETGAVVFPSAIPHALQRQGDDLAEDGPIRLRGSAAQGAVFDEAEKTALGSDRHRQNGGRGEAEKRT